MYVVLMLFVYFEFKVLNMVYVVNGNMYGYPVITEHFLTQTGLHTPKEAEDAQEEV